MPAIPDGPAPPAPDVLAPLTAFYTDRELESLDVSTVTPEDMPPQARHLLVHEGDMTSRLADAYDCPIGLKPIRIVRDDPASLSRMVALYKTSDGGRVEFGGIRIDLEALDEPVRAGISACGQPLGAVLIRHGIPIVSRARAYLRFTADPVIADGLEIAERTTVYARSNVLSTGGVRFAHVLEVLPPAAIQPMTA